MLILSTTLLGCKGRVEKTETAGELVTEESALMVTEPAQDIAVTEAIPPSAVPETVAKPVSQAALDRDRDIQKALKKAGFYAGSIDGKIGPKTKKAIEEFQKAKGLKADGKVGPKTWAELENYLAE
jgi:peptidoglycan hydrolase-like protein with peptidoglycan-binding domain